MAQKALAVGDFIINDWEKLDAATATISSSLMGGIGLPSSKAEIAGRYGRWPLVAGLSRADHRLTLETRFRGTDKETQRRNLLAALNPESETVVKLRAADQVLPEGIIAHFGPWNIYPDDTGAWFADDLLGDITGTFNTVKPPQFADGSKTRQRAFACEGAVTNLITNPSVETNATNHGVAGGGGASGARTTDKAKYGGYSYEITLAADATADGWEYSQAALSGSTMYTASLWLWSPLGSQLAMTFYDGVDQTVGGTITGTGDWQRVTLTHTTNASPSTTRLRVLQTVTVQEMVYYIDAVQIEQRSYATAYCDGSLGQGFSWSGTDHGSSSTKLAGSLTVSDYAHLVSGKWEFTVRVVARMPEDADGTWRSTPHYLWQFQTSPAGSIPNPVIALYYDSTADTWDVYFAGSERMNSAVQTFSAGDVLDLIVTIDHNNDSHAFYIEGSESDTSSANTAPPIVDEWAIGCTAANGNHGDFQIEEFTVWDRALTAAEVAQMNTNGTVAGRARYLEVLCEAAQPLIRGETRVDEFIISTLAVHDDVRWRSRDGDSNQFGLYDDTAFANISPDSDDDVYPILRLKPISSKTAGNGYARKRWIRVDWDCEREATRYPVCITFDGATEISGGDLQSDGDDIRVRVNGAEVDRWFDTGSGAGQINNANANVWFNLDFEPTIALTLKTAIAGAGDIDEIELNEDISLLPNSGILFIGSEVFTYTEKINSDKKVTGIVRDAKGTSQAAHAVDADVEWIQHDVYMFYGDSSATAPIQNDDKTPAFELDLSSNTSWVYEEFGEDLGLRSGQWLRFAELQDTEFYGGDNGAAADPWIELGIHCPDKFTVGRIFLYNPCGITNANFTNGEKYAATRLSGFRGFIRSSVDGWEYVDEYSVPDPTTAATWQAWSQNEALTSGSLYVALHLEDVVGGDYYLEAADCTVTLDSTYTPTVTAYSEADNYEMSLTIENETTGHSLTMIAGLVLDQILEIDTASKTVRELSENVSLIAGLTLIGNPRKDWLKLQPGDNIISFTDTGQNEVDVEMWWDRRYWE